ncbi:MAG: rhomboid family intramembrane serine protease [Hyphomicrobiaceae bacterium]
MFVPLRDDNPLRVIRWQWVTVGLIVANVIIFGLQLAISDERYIASFAAIPSELLGSGGGAARGPYDGLAIPEALTLVTYQFLHGSPLHLIGNMLFLWVFGDNIEDAMGHLRFLAFYLLCGIAGGLAHAVMTPASTIPLIGASGAVAGVIAAYLILHPRVRVWVLAFRFIPLRITAAWALGAWIATQFVMLLMPDGSPVAWWAHIGGILAGALLIVFMRRRGVPLFDQGQRFV